jgi:hypothetical protein
MGHNTNPSDVARMEFTEYGETMLLHNNGDW